MYNFNNNDSETEKKWHQNYLQKVGRCIGM